MKINKTLLSQSYLWTIASKNDLKLVKYTMTYCHWLWSYLSTKKFKDCPLWVSQRLWSCCWDKHLRDHGLLFSCFKICNDGPLGVSQRLWSCCWDKHLGDHGLFFPAAKYAMTFVPLGFLSLTLIGDWNWAKVICEEGGGGLGQLKIKPTIVWSLLVKCLISFCVEG